MSDSQTPTQENPNPNPNPNPNSAHFAADPLLKPGSFIDPTPSVATTVDPPESRRPAPKSTVESGDATPRPSPGKKRGSEPMDWLPPGWKVETKERTSGATAGLVDKYYYEIATGRRFRSKKEVLSYLQTGDVPKGPKRKKENSDARKTESLETKKKNFVMNFDFSNAPEDVTWIPKRDLTESWTAELNGQEVPELTRQEWDAAKDHVFASGSVSMP